MAKLPHLREDIVASKHYEPVYPALFDVRIQFPAAVDDSQREIMLDNITAVSGLETEKLPDKVEQKFKGVTRSFAGAVIGDTSHEVTVTFNVNLDDANSMFAYRLLKQWSNLIYDTESGERGLATEYKAGTSMTITLFNKRQQVFRTYKAVDIFLGSQIENNLTDFDYTNNEPIDPMSVTFVCDRIDVIDN